jgi:chromosome segregation protein
LFEGKKIGRVKNLEKLNEDIVAQDAIVIDLKHEIQTKHNEVIAFNEQLKEQAIKQAQEDISRLTNMVFSLQNKIENLHASQHVSEHRLQEYADYPGRNNCIGGRDEGRMGAMVNLLNELKRETACFRE